MARRIFFRKRLKLQDKLSEDNLFCQNLATLCIVNQCYDRKGCLIENARPLQYFYLMIDFEIQIGQVGNW